MSEENKATEGERKKNPEDAIELDPLNSNPCMIKILIIEEMQKKFGNTYSAIKMFQDFKEMNEYLSRAALGEIENRPKNFVTRLYSM